VERHACSILPVPRSGCRVLAVLLWYGVKFFLSCPGCPVMVRCQVLAVLL
jgi:hypothetical protein